MFSRRAEQRQRGPRRNPVASASAGAGGAGSGAAVNAEREIPVEALPEEVLPEAIPVPIPSPNAGGSCTRNNAWRGHKCYMGLY